MTTRLSGAICLINTTGERHCTRFGPLWVWFWSTPSPPREVATREVPSADYPDFSATVLHLAIRPKSSSSLHPKFSDPWRCFAVWFNPVHATSSLCSASALKKPLGEIWAPHLYQLKLDRKWFPLLSTQLTLWQLKTRLFGKTCISTFSCQMFHDLERNAG